MRGVIRSGFVILMLFVTIYSADAQTTPKKSLHSVINKIEYASNYHFLYRDALIADVKIPYHPNITTCIDSLHQELAAHNIGVRIDRQHKQILLYEMKKDNKSRDIKLSGQVVDNETGQRLPFATLTWKDGKDQTGTNTDEDGNFLITLKPSFFHDDSLTLHISFIGYQKQSLSIQKKERNYNDITVRLNPKPFQSKEVIITGNSYYQPLNKALKNIIQLGTFSPVGESSSIRSLQTFPAVSLNVGLHEGINIRGSSSDGLRVLLDGAPIYNQSHLFGLLDIFNSDVLQTVGFHYGIIPARYEGALGGTLSLMTRTGSQNNTHITVGLSNTAYKGTVEGSLFHGKGSWIISGRHSYMNAINWFNNKGLISWGLNVNRDKSLLVNPKVYNTQTSFPQTPIADYYDFHTKWLYESQKGSRISLSAYVGGDYTRESTNKYVIVSNSPNFKDRFKLKNYTTENDWGNVATSLNYTNPLGNDKYSHTLVSFSYYHSNYYKQDFLYNRQAGNDRIQSYLYPFHNQNYLSDFKIDQNFEIPTNLGLWTLGATYHYYDITYQEQSVQNPGFVEKFKSNLIDAYGEYDIKNINYVNFYLGGRTHYFTDGHYFRFSPRLKMKILPNRPVSFAVGFSRDYQFIHRLSLYNESSSDLWILTTHKQGPSNVSYWTSGMYIKPDKSTYFQVEAYIKNFANLRQHDINTRALPESDLNSPWFYNNKGYARGIEFLYQQHIGKLLWNNAYTLSKIQLQNKALNNGKRFYANWDHRDKISSSLEVPFLKFFKFYANWMFATGGPNQLASPDNKQPKRLPDYMRVDVSLKFHHHIDHSKVTASFSVFNLLNRKNVWYRENTLAFDKQTYLPQLTFVPVNVYDLGIQPSFEVRVHF
ncbi:MAG TPA: TonB-dependent receptor [Balneolales bacterium]|nr:TonB-dependent receptor [Balneolales bacterium]